MSKRALKKYLTDLSKDELEEQITELYDRLKEVKEFYTKDALTSLGKGEKIKTNKTRNVGCSIKRVEH